MALQPAFRAFWVLFTSQMPLGKARVGAYQPNGLTVSHLGVTDSRKPHAFHLSIVKTTNFECGTRPNGPADAGALPLQQSRGPQGCVKH